MAALFLLAALLLFAPIRSTELINKLHRIALTPSIGQNFTSSSAARSCQMLGSPRYITLVCEQSQVWIYQMTNVANSQEGDSIYASSLFTASSSVAELKWCATDSLVIGSGR